MYDETSQHRQMRRRDGLNLAAGQLGYTSWSAFESDVINNRVRVEVIQVPLGDRKPLVRPSPYKNMPHKTQLGGR